MGKITVAMTKCLNIRAYAINSTDIVEMARSVHNTTPTVTAALGRTLTAASMMGYMMKNEDDSLTLNIKGDGPIGGIVTVSDYKGNVRGYAVNPNVDLPLNSKHKLDVAGAVGKGNLTVIKDLGLKEPYIGKVPLVSGEIAEDVTSYFATSEQTPTVCALGVLVNTDLTVKAAGGYIIQLMPFTEDSVIDKLEENLKYVRPISSMIDSKLSNKEILKEVLKGFELEFIEEKDVVYECKCSLEKTEKILISLGKEELKKIYDEDGKAEVVCHFCGHKYNFDKSALEKIIKNI